MHDCCGVDGLLLVGFSGGLDAAFFFKSRVCSLAGNAEGCSEEMPHPVTAFSQLALLENEHT